MLQQKCVCVAPFPDRASPQSELNGVQVRQGTPDFSNQTLLSDVDVAEIERVVDGLHLPHFNKPHTQVLSSSL